MRRSVRATLVPSRAQAAQLAAGADGLDPAEDLHDKLAPALALAVDEVPGRAPVDRAAPAALVLRHMLRETEAAQVSDEFARVVGAVGPRGLRPGNAAFEDCQSQPLLCCLRLHKVVIFIPATDNGQRSCQQTSGRAQEFLRQRSDRIDCRSAEVSHAREPVYRGYLRIRDSPTSAARCRPLKDAGRSDEPD